MTDLVGQGSAFDAEAAPWYQSTYWTSGVKTSTCGSDRLMGGYKVLGGANTKGQYWERQYTGIPTPHNVVYLTIKIYPIDGWDKWEDDHFEIWLDSQKIIAWTLETYSPPAWYPNICGDPTYLDVGAMWMYATLPHALSTMTFRVVSSLNQASDDESLGFRDIKMEFKQISNPPSSYSFCGSFQGFFFAFQCMPMS